MNITIKYIQYTIKRKVYYTIASRDAMENDATQRSIQISANIIQPKLDKFQSQCE